MKDKEFEIIVDCVAKSIRGLMMDDADAIQDYAKQAGEKPLKLSIGVKIPCDAGGQITTSLSYGVRRKTDVAFVPDETADLFPENKSDEHKES